MASSPILTPLHALTFGPLNLIGTAADLIADGFKLETLGTDADFGNPVPIEEKVISWLQDGAIVALQGHDNRDMYMKVLVSAEDSDGLAQGEAALMLQTNKRNTLIWTPPDGAGEPCVFDVVMSHIELVTDLDSELYLERTYGLRIQAAPFARAKDLVSVTKAAPSGSQTLTTVDNGSSFTGWTAGPANGTAGGTITTGVSGGTAVFVNGAAFTQFGSPHMFTIKLVRSGLSASLATTPYIRVDTTLALAGGMFKLTFQPTFVLNGVTVPIAIQYGNIYWLDTTGLGLGSTLNTFEVNWAEVYATGSTGTVNLSVADVSRSNVLGEPSTGRQLARTLEVAGTARTQGNLLLEDASNALGSVLVYTCPAVAGLVQPNLRTMLSSGNSQTVDSTTVSGFTSDLSVLHTFDIPVTGLLEGGHILLARVKHAASGARTLTWSAKARQGSTTLAGSQDGTTNITLTTGGAYQIVTVAKLNLPPRKLGLNGKVRIELTASSGVTLDEAWLCNVESGKLTKVECGTAAPSAGGAANRLWLDAPSLESPEPALYLGHASDRSDSYHAASEAESFLVHEFDPSSMNVFTVTTNSTASSITLSHYPRFHTHVVAA